MTNSIRTRLRALALSVALATFGTTASALAAAETRTIEADGVTYAYRTYGPETGQPIVLSQRFRGNMDDWDPGFIEALAKVQPVIVFNSAGVSTSSGEVPDTIDAMADHMAAFVTALDRGPVDALGWSMGGFVVQSLAARRPDLVDQVILVGTGPAASPETPAPVDGVFEVATRPAYGEEDREYLFFADAPESRERAEASMARIDAARDLSTEPATTPGVMGAQAAAIQSWLGAPSNAFAALGTIEAPALVVSGDRDPFFPVQAATLLYRELPNARLAIYPMAGHAPHHQWPEHVTTTIETFLAETASE